MSAINNIFVIFQKKLYPMKFNFTILFIALALVFLACKKEQVGGKCEYVTIKKNASVSFIDGKLDSIFMISFQPKGIDSDEIYRITNKELKKLKKNFNLSDLLNKNNIYEITIAERKTGSCVPFVIKEITLKE